MTDDDLLHAFKSRAARVSVGASTVRGRGNAGVAAKSRQYLLQLDLRTFSPETGEQFENQLNSATRGLLDALPEGAQHWGLARKVLNIFLRDCLYTKMLDDAYFLSKHIDCFELPLDSITARNLKRVAGRGKLPAWPGVKKIDARLSSEFQEVAAIVADRLGTSRIHLDAIWWSVSRDGKDVLTQVKNIRRTGAQ